MSINRIVLMGNITRDLELRSTPSGKSVLQFSVAVERDAKDANGNKKTDFIDCVSWNGTAEFISRNFVKGSAIAIDGKLQIDEWTDKEGGKRKASKILVQSVSFCGRKYSQNNKNQNVKDGNCGFFDEIGNFEYDLPDEFR